MSKVLDGKVVLITGAGGGIGREIALAAAKVGVAIVVNDLGVSVKGTGQTETARQKVTDKANFIPLDVSAAVFSWDPV